MHRPLTEVDLFPTGPLGRLGRQVAMLGEVESTNSHLLAQPEAWGDGAVVCAEFQSAGRGRQGRRWLAPRGSSILLSVLLIEPEGSPLPAHATMLGVLAMAEAVEMETGYRPGLRWPNDLAVGGRKLGGVLAESRSLLPASYTRRAGERASETANQERQRAVVIGIGLNCLQQPGHFAAELAGIATSLEIECPQPIDRPAIARRLVQRLDTHLTNSSQHRGNWGWLREAWTARCDDLGLRVAVEENARRYTGTVLDIAENGDLLLQLDSGGRRRFEPTTTTRIR